MLNHFSMTELAYLCDEWWWSPWQPWDSSCDWWWKLLSLLWARVVGWWHIAEAHPGPPHSLKCPFQGWCYRGDPHIWREIRNKVKWKLTFPVVRTGKMREREEKGGRKDNKSKEIAVRALSAAGYEISTRHYLVLNAMIHSFWIHIVFCKSRQSVMVMVKAAGVTWWRWGSNPKGH